MTALKAERQARSKVRITPAQSRKKNDNLSLIRVQNQRLNMLKCCLVLNRFRKYLLTSNNMWSELFTKETLMTFIPGSLSHIHLKTFKIEAKNVVKLKNI